MTQLLSWEPIDFDRWQVFTAVLHPADPYGGDNLNTAISRLQVSWDRLRDDLLKLFVPSGPEGTHAHHHYHAPVDPEERRQVLATIVVDYESALVFLDVALDLTARCLGAAAHLPIKTWKHLFTASEAREPPLTGDVCERVLYLQRSVLYARNFAIAHPRDHIAGAHYDNVGNITFWRYPRSPDLSTLPGVDALLHEVRDVRDAYHVGPDIDPYLALSWIASRSGLLDENGRKRFDDYRKQLGYWLPAPREVATAIDSLIVQLISLLPINGPGQLALANVTAHGSRLAVVEPSGVVAAPASADAKELEAELERGVRLGESGDHLGAELAFRRAVELAPDEGIVRAQHAVALKRLGERAVSSQAPSRSEPAHFESIRP